MSKFTDTPPPSNNRPVCRSLGVPPGRGSCPLTGPLPFDLIYTDYHGLQQMKQHMGLSLRKHRSVAVLSLLKPRASVPRFCSRSWVTPGIASLIKDFTIALLAAGHYRPLGFIFIYFISLLLCRQNSRFGAGEIQFGLFSLWSIKQVLFKCTAGK